MRLLLLLALSLSLDLSACSRIFWNNTVAKVSCRTFDFLNEDNPTFILWPRGIQRSGFTDNPLTWTSNYGSLSISAFGQENMIAEGMNEKGLAAHVLYLFSTNYGERNKQPGLANVFWAQYILDQFATVKEALAALDSFQIVPVEILGRKWPLHLCLEDASGDAAVIEFIKGKMNVYQGAEASVLTSDPPLEQQLNNLKNYRYFKGKLSLPGDVDPKSRFVRASAFLSTLPVPKSVGQARGYVFGLIRNVQIPYGAIDTSDTQSVIWPTRWISACDLTSESYYFISSASSRMISVELKNVDFSTLSAPKKLSLLDPALEGESSSQFK